MLDISHKITGTTGIFGIIGKPVHHSLSPEMHNASFLELGLDCVYVPLPTSHIAEAVAGLKALGFKGVSVTIPYKQDVIPFVDVLDPVAEKIGAVNTLVIREEKNSPEKTVSGYNTDWIGANRALAEKIGLKGSRILIMGAGGSARAIGFGLLEAGAEVMLTNRTEAKGRALAEQLGSSFFRPGEIGRVKADALVNATSVGMVPDTGKSPLPPVLLPNFSVVMDIVYAPLKTRLLMEAETAGCEVVDGLKMLLYQGAAQFKLWTGREAPLAVMRDVLYRRFA
ncbi:MAG: shikimate dehydrogenase [Desulfobulbaceae bacterium]|nr:shikimate dehydrogenase [Desulfobulbaceae bacterium]